MKARNWWLIVLVVIVVAGVGGWAALRHSRPGRRADLAAGYVAHVVCSCRYVGRRDMKSCATDFEPGMAIVQVRDDPAARRITAWVPLLTTHTATWSPAYGCALDRR